MITDSINQFEYEHLMVLASKYESCHQLEVKNTHYVYMGIGNKSLIKQQKHACASSSSAILIDL